MHFKFIYEIREHDFGVGNMLPVLCFKLPVFVQKY